RKNSLILSAVLFILSAFGTGFADGLTAFIVYRLVGGLGIGLASTLAPMYIAEIAPAKYRGRFVSINQLTIVVRILAAQIPNWALADATATDSGDSEVHASWNGHYAWRWMFWGQMIPAALFFLSMFTIPKSPRVLVKAGN